MVEVGIYGSPLPAKRLPAFLVFFSAVSEGEMKGSMTLTVRITGKMQALSWPHKI